jgi:glycosyltransferase involved in cell wall biosynthesis
MKISIITVSFNSSQTITDTINSVLAQTYSEIEYIVVDGSSSDNTIEIVMKFEPLFAGRMKWISEPDKGLYHAMNKGIRMATGDVIGIINSDDLFCDNRAVEKVIRVFEQNKTLDSVYADLYYVAQNDTDKIVRRWRTGEQRKFKFGWHPAHPTFYVKREVYEKFGLFNLDFKLAADFEIMLRFLEKYKISCLYLKEPLVKMRLGGETNKSYKNILNQNVECVRAFIKNDLRVNRVMYPFFRVIPKLFQYTR